MSAASKKYVRQNNNAKAMTEIIPTILAQSKEEFISYLERLEPHVQMVHIDVLDGTLFPHTSWADPRAVGAIRTDIAFELHLMVENPILVAEAWKQEVRTLRRAIFHAELDRQHGSIIEHLHWLKLEAGMALNPETPIDEAIHDIAELEELLLMTVHPGTSGQGLGDPAHQIAERELLEKTREIHERFPSIILGCDGGMNAKTIPHFAQAGISRFCVGSAISQAKDPAQALEEMKQSLHVL